MLLLIMSISIVTALSYYALCQWRHE